MFKGELNLNATDVFPSLLSAIASHEEGSARLSILNDVTAHSQSLLGALENVPERKGAHFRATAKRYALVLFRFNFVALVCRKKIDAIISMIGYSVGAKNAIALAQGARSLVEHVAVQAQITKALERLSTMLKGQTDGVKIHEALNIAEEFLHRCYFGRSPKVEVKKVDQALHIVECVDALAARYEGASKDYDFLCEFVHPNHGSNSLVSSDELSIQVSSIVTDLNRSEVQRMGEIALNMLRVSDEIEMVSFSRIGLLGGYAQRFLQGSAKISNVFSVRKVKPEGDGQTKETAFHFPGAKDPYESFELWSAYVERHNIKILDRNLETIEGGSAFDVYETAQGKIWCRIDYERVGESRRGADE